MRASVATNVIEEHYNEMIENLLEEVRRELKEEYMIFNKIRNHYVKIQASAVTTYTRLTRLRSACKLARRIFNKPLTKLTKDEWESLSAYMYSKYRTRDSIVSAIHPLRLTLKYLGFPEKERKELFPYPSSIKAKSQNETPPPYVPGHVLDKVIFAIGDDMYRALFSLMRITGARIEEITLLKRENIIDDEDGIYVYFNITKNGLPREVPLNWEGFEKHLKTFMTWFNHQHPKRG